MVVCVHGGRSLISDCYRYRTPTTTGSTENAEQASPISIDLTYWLACITLSATVVSPSLANNVPNDSRSYGEWEENKYLSGAYEGGNKGKRVKSAARLSRTTLTLPSRQIGKRFGYSVCVDETQKVMDTLEAANFFIQPIYKYVKAVDDCVEKLREERMKPKATTLYHLSKYVNQRKHKKK